MRLDELMKVLDKDTVLYLFDSEKPFSLYSIREDCCPRIGIADHKLKVVNVRPSYCDASALEVVIRIPNDD